MKNLIFALFLVMSKFVFAYEDVAQILDNSVVISLNRHMNRYLETKKNMENAGFTNIQRFEAIDGHFKDESFFQNLKIFGGGPGQKGCTASHLLVWKQFLETSDKDLLFVAEDDMLPHTDFSWLFPLYWDLTPKPFDLVLVGSKMLDITDQDPLIVKKWGWCTHAYIISKEGAKKLLKLYETCPKDEDSYYVIDIFLTKMMWENQINYYCYNGQFFKDEKNIEAGNIFPTRDSGICFQHQKLGTTIHGVEIIYE
jgi:GR25 family glycosyltransferase involved in LPS biosynthesis